jgi:3-oxoacyl-[acyl-carrier protein] reductase/bacilysin biosynthesis oxidoreductase BacG
MDLSLKDKVVILTGASRGIGRAALSALASEGAVVAAVARAGPDLERAVLEETASGRRVQAFACDMASDIEVPAMVDAVAARFGRIDVLVNNAAGVLPAGDFLSISSEAWLRAWTEKVQWYVRACQAVFPKMRDGGGGRIVNVVGTAARNPRASYMAVGMANAALVNFTKALADLGAPHGILTVAVAPSGVLTERYLRLIEGRAGAEGKTAEQLQRKMDATFPLGRMARPEEVGDVLCFLASARASYISGSLVSVDGASSRGVFN